MASLLTVAQAGTLESSDIMITVSPGSIGSGIIIELESIVMAQYGEDIKKTLKDAVAEQGYTDLYIKALDRGALDCTIRARMITALGRGGAGVKEAML